MTATLALLILAALVTLGALALVAANGRVTAEVTVSIVARRLRPSTEEDGP